jgi:hypothetical protein
MKFGNNGGRTRAAGTDDGANHLRGVREERKKKEKEEAKGSVSSS